MLHILWLILKVILILLGIVIGLILLGALLLLFCPVRYRGKVKKERTEGIREIEAFGEISWLFHGISVKAFWQGVSPETEIYVLGIPLSKLKAFRDRRKKKPQTSLEKTEFQNAEKKRESPVIIIEENSSVESEEGTQQTDIPVCQEEKPDMPKEGTEYNIQDSVEESSRIPLADEIKKDEKKSRKSISGLISGIVEKIKKAGRALRKRICSVIEFPGKIQKKIRNFALTIRKFCDKIKRWRNFINHPRTRAAISLVWKDAKKLLRHIFPTKVTGMITFGCEDPAGTGTVLAVMGMTIPFHKNKVTVKPLFDGENILEGEIMLKGRIYGVILLKTAVELYFNKNIKYVIHRWRHKEVKHGERE